MKLLFAAAMLCSLLTTKLSAQMTPEKEPNPVIVTRFQITLPDDARRSEFDSLVNIYVDKGIRPNAMIKNYRLLRHWWGSNNMEVVMIYEVDSWNNINKAMEEADKLIDAAITDKAAREKYWTRFGKYLNKHSDEIMADIGKPKM
jgi:hypothetical protein